MLKSVQAKVGNSYPSPNELAKDCVENRLCKPMHVFGIIERCGICNKYL